MDTELEHKDDAGFTLIELLIVLVVISILSVSVGLSLNLGRGKNGPPDDSARFVNYFNDLQNAAIHGQKRRGIKISISGWQNVPFDQDTGSWGKAGPEIRWRGGAVFQKPLGGSGGDFNTPDIILMPDGRVSPFKLRISQDQRFATCSTDGFTGVSCRSE